MALVVLVAPAAIVAPVAMVALVALVAFMALVALMALGLLSEGVPCVFHCLCLFLFICCCRVCLTNQHKKQSWYCQVLNGIVWYILVLSCIDINSVLPWSE